jgi:hypothetical protein
VRRRAAYRVFRRLADVIALDGEESFEVSDELEAIILESIAQGRQGDVINAKELLQELRSRE